MSTVVLSSRYQNHSGQQFAARLRSTLADSQTWRDLGWLVAQSVLGLVFGIVALSLACSVLGLAMLPAWNWAIPGGSQFGLWTVDSLSLAFLTALLALPHAVVTVGLIRGMAAAEHGLARVLLD